MVHQWRMEFSLRTMLLVSLGPLLANETSKDTMTYETPDLQMVEGDNATIKCCFKANNLATKHRVTWIKNELQVVAQIVASEPANNSICADLRLADVTRNHTGRYACSVITEIPTFRRFAGNGTTVTVTARQSPAAAAGQTNSTKESPEDPSPSFPLGAVVSLPVVMAAFFIALICFWKLQKRQALDRAARVIYEVPHRDSEADGTSTSSSKGSSQWCQVPVYESFDYFEQVDSKGSG